MSKTLVQLAIEDDGFVCKSKGHDAGKRIKSVVPIGGPKIIYISNQENGDSHILQQKIRQITPNESNAYNINREYCFIARRLDLFGNDNPCGVCYPIQFYKIPAKLVKAQSS